MQEGKISVILPVYIVSEHLANLTKDCLMSIEGEYDELIIIDNNSPLPVEQFQKMADIYIRNKKNLPHSAINFLTDT